jgi:hypothetical protein
MYRLFLLLFTLPLCAIGIGGDLLYWRAHEDGLDFSMSGYGSSSQEGALYAPPSDAAAGFAIWASLPIPQKGWLLQGRYISYSPQAASRSVGVDPAKGELIPTTLVQPETPFASLLEAHGSFTFSMHTLDLELGAPLDLLPSFSLTPFAGMKGSWQSQRLGVTTLPTFFTEQHQRQWGIGIRGGARAAFHFAEMWSLFSDLALTAMWGHFDVTRTDTTIRTKRDIYTIFGLLEWDIGLRTSWVWGGVSCAVQAGWELQLWQDQNRFIYGPGGDLSLQGLTLHAALDF